MDIQTNGFLAEEVKGELGDKLTCQCLFFRQYQLPCQHLFQFDLVSDVIKDSDWDVWASMFEDYGFEIYESTTKDFVAKEIFDEPGGPNKHLLQVREVLDDVKNSYYQMQEIMADWDADECNAKSKQFVRMLRKMTGSVRQQGAMKALKQLDDEGHRLGTSSDDEADDGEVDPSDGQRAIALRSKAGNSEGGEGEGGDGGDGDSEGSDSDGSGD